MSLVALELAGALLLALLFAQLALLLLASVRRLAAERAQRQNECAVFQERLAAARCQRKKSELIALAWNGTRKFRIDRKVRECEAVCSFYLRPHDNKPLPAFHPGQYLTFELDVPGQTKRVVRCYSLSERPRGDYYRVTIKSLPPPPDHPEVGPGVASSFFHERLSEGDIVDVKAPAGSFVLDSSRNAPVVLIAGGVGITPLLSMLNEIVESDGRRECWLFYGVRASHQHIMKAHLEQVARAFENVHLQVCYSHPAPADRLGTDYQHAEHVSIDLLKRLLPSNNYDFFVCGPPPMMNALIPGLREWGVPAHNLHSEAFGPASVRRTPLATETAAAKSGLTVTFARSGKTLPWSGQTDSLLELAEAAGVTIDFGCRAGNCGTCKTAIKSGNVSYQKQPGCEVESGTCLTCICVPETGLVLDA
jgi:hypothetical protein